MNKKTTLLVAAACLGLTLNAEVLSPQMAWQRASNGSQARIPAVNTKSTPRLLFTASAAAEPACYVFDGVGGEGYVVVSADDVAAPVLGYSLTGRFDSEQIPCQLRDWLDFYAAEIEYARSVGAPAYQAPSRSSLPEIAPMLKTTWDQGAPYNNDCPISGGRHTVTGCVATAMAQIMKYHNYPVQPQGTVSYTSGQLKLNVTVDFDQMTFDWDNMLDSYPYGSYGTEQQRAAVAQLMYGVAASLKMDFGVDESAASTQSVPTALMKNFDYSKGVHILYRDLYQKAEWEQYIYDNLRDCGPILYRGNDATNAGHAFVLDGYADGYYHFNWGWSGLSDGYYLLSGLDPLSQGIGGGTPGAVGFVYGQAIVLGITPHDDAGYFYMMYLSNGFTLPTKATSLGSSITVKCEYFNGSNTTIDSGTIGLEYIDASGKSTYVRGTMLAKLPSNYGYSNYEVSVPSSLSDGKYKVRPAWANSDYKVRPVLVNYYQTQTYTAEVQGGKVTFTPDELGTASVKAESVKMLSDTYASKYMTAEITFTNTSDVEYFNTIRMGLFATDATEGAQPLYKGKEMMIDIGVGETCVVEYHSNFAGSQAGSYKLCVYDPRTLKWLSSPLEVTLTDAPKTVITASGLRLVDGTDYAFKDSDVAVEFDLTCESGFYEGFLYIALVRNSENYWRKSYTTPYISIHAGETQHYTMSIALPSVFKVGNTATIAVVTASKKTDAEQLSEPYVFTIADPSGITDVEAGAEVVATKLYNLQGVEVPAEAAAPGHYIEVRHHADGTTTATHILK